MCLLGPPRDELNKLTRIGIEQKDQAFGGKHLADYDDNVERHSKVAAHPLARIILRQHDSAMRRLHEIIPPTQDCPLNLMAAFPVQSARFVAIHDT